MKASNKVAAPSTSVIYLPEIGTPYRRIQAFKKEMGRFTLAGMIVLGAMGITKGGNVSKAQRTVNLDALQVILGRSAFNHWVNTTKRINANGFTDAGYDEIAKRLQGKGAYGTSPEAVREVMDVMKKGGKLKMGTIVVDFAAKVEI